MTLLRSIVRLLLLLVALSFVMSIVQWLAAPSGGAKDMAYIATDLDHPMIGSMLLRINSSRVLRLIDDVWQRSLNAPRNQLLHDFGYIYGPEHIYFYGSSHTTWAGNLRSAFIFAIGTVVTYLPMMIGIAFVRVSGWNVMKKPVLIALAVFVAATGIFALMSNAESNSKSATIFTALPLLTAAVGIMWTPLLMRPRRVSVMVVLLVSASAIGMVATTTSTGPSDTLSYPIFFAWSLAVLLAEGGAFLLLVGGINRLMSRGRHEPPPSGPMELRTTSDDGPGHRHRAGPNTSKGNER